ncbi:hypothetical protein LTS07_005986 [Exophiala sideris]|uniref:Uncharacterized protein n=1 Tax=Exophiala sideris TaxID=1016849 RepID=A0ABR0J7D9_9EURO|nr:hypothetical protein LTS07_005986 [Exophiala sideris]KAK5058153.1 hypothetical protein LTR69_007150 [Exophiala sideris]KAK5182113.1 hypothetical protein LTR44_005714 [Eurotiomycetes sp. CCFEE 6388]
MARGGGTTKALFWLGSFLSRSRVPRKVRLRDSREEPLFTETLKFALYRSAAAQLLGTTLAKTQEPWPQGYAMLEAVVKQQSLTGERLVDGPATVSDLWKVQAKRTEYAKRMLQSWTMTKERSGTGREMDALLIPCTPWPASPK